MGQTGIVWGGWSQKARLGVNVRWDDIGPFTTQSHVWADFYYGTNAWGYSGTYSIDFNGSLGGNSGNFTFYSPSGGSVTTFITTYDMGVQNTSYSGGPSWTIGAILHTALYDGGRPSISYGWSLPARPATVPDAPSAPSISAITTSSATVSFVVPNLNGSAATDTSFWLYNAAGTLVAADPGVSLATSYTFTGLAPNATYYAEVAIANGIGWSGKSGRTAFNTAAGPPGTPGTPLATSITQDSAAQSWSPSGTNGTPVTTYRLQIAATADFASPVYDNTSSGTSRNASGLWPFTQYYSRVLANSAAGSSGWSPTGSFKTSFGMWAKPAATWVKAKLWVKPPGGTWKLGKLWVRPSGGSWTAP